MTTTTTATATTTTTANTTTNYNNATTTTKHIPLIPPVRTRGLPLYKTGPPQKQADRLVVHELAVHYGLVTQSFDIEPARYVSAIKKTVIEGWIVVRFACVVRFSVFCWLV